MRLIIRDYRHWKIKNDALKIGVLTMVMVVVWIGVEMYQNYTQTTVPKDYKKYLEPLNPSLDLEVLDNLENRLDLPEEFKVLTGGPKPSRTASINQQEKQATQAAEIEQSEEGVEEEVAQPEEGKEETVIDLDSLSDEELNEFLQSIE